MKLKLAPILTELAAIVGDDEITMADAPWVLHVVGVLRATIMRARATGAGSVTAAQLEALERILSRMESAIGPPEAAAAWRPAPSPLDEIMRIIGARDPVAVLRMLEAGGFTEYERQRLIQCISALRSLADAAAPASPEGPCCSP